MPGCGSGFDRNLGLLDTAHSTVPCAAVFGCDLPWPVRVLRCIFRLACCTVYCNLYSLIEYSRISYYVTVCCLNCVGWPRPVSCGVSYQYRHICREAKERSVDRVSYVTQLLYVYDSAVYIRYYSIHEHDGTADGRVCMCYLQYSTIVRVSSVSVCVLTCYCLT